MGADIDVAYVVDGVHTLDRVSARELHHRPNECDKTRDIDDTDCSYSDIQERSRRAELTVSKTI